MFLPLKGTLASAFERYSMTDGLFENKKMRLKRSKPS